MFLLITFAKLRTLFLSTKGFGEKISLYHKIFCSAYILPPLYIISLLFVNPRQSVLLSPKCPRFAKVSHAHPSHKPHNAPHCGTLPPHGPMSHTHPRHNVFSPPSVWDTLAKMSIFANSMTRISLIWYGPEYAAKIAAARKSARIP